MRAPRSCASRLALLLAAAALSSAAAVSISVPANGNECFFSSAQQGEKVHASFNVFAGGFLDINLKVYGPDDRVIFEEERTTTESFTFIAQQNGRHKFCFFNSMSTVTAKHISFTISVGHVLQDKDVAKAEHLNPLENVVVTLSQALRGVSDEQKYMKVRERVSHTTNKSTNRRVLWFSLLKTIMLVGISLAKIYFLRKFFESKRTI